MKLTSYIGVDEPVITIEKPTDLYPALDHIQNVMMELYDETGNEEFEKCADFIGELMDSTEKKGFGNYEDVESIDHY